MRTRGEVPAAATRRLTRNRALCSARASSPLGSSSRASNRTSPRALFVAASSSTTALVQAPSPAPSVDELKSRLLRLASSSDRGQLHNALVWGDAYSREREAGMAAISALEAVAPPLDVSLLDGDWELVYTDGAQLFRSSPFFLAVSEAFKDPKKSNLFFALHELQVASFGISRYGVVTQHLDIKAGVLTSSFTTLLFGLTVIPIIGWFKLLPTFGGRVVSIAKALTVDAASGETAFELDITRVEKADGIPLLPLIGRFFIDRNTPVGAVWKLLPWNGGRPPACRVRCSFVDATLRIVRDRDGAVFVYARC